MSRPAGNSNCDVCDGSEYYLDAGFYYCQECHTQSKDVRETAFEETFTPGLSRSFRIRNKSSADKERGYAVKWTSWQGFNFILKGLVDELIALGAKPELKIIVLQLWSKYLSKLEAAFISTTDPELPKFGLNQCEKDFDIIYGTKKVRKKKLVKKKKEKLANLFDSFDPNTSSQQKNKAVNKMRKAVLKEDYELIREEIRLTQDVMSQVDERLKQMSQEVTTEASEPLLPTTVLYNKEAVRIATLRKKRQGVDANCDVDLTSIDTDSCSKSIDYYNPYRLTRLKLIGLLVLALNLSKEDIQISDLIRWISEGHLSFQKVTHLFPDHLDFSSGDSVFLQTSVERPTYKAVLVTAASVADLLGVQRFPTPDLASLARRYILQLQLPAQLADCVERLVASSRCVVGDDSEAYVNYEGLAMAYVVMAVKLLWGLDGETERRISEVADLVNRIPGDSTFKDCHNLFVWDEWVRHVECRKAVLVQEHFPTKHRLDVSIATPVGPYLDFLRSSDEKNENLDARILCRQALGKVCGPLTKKMKWSVGQLPDYENTEHPSLVFPPTLTPLTSYLNIIVDARRHDDTFPLDVLTEDHTAKSITFLLEPQDMIAYAQANGMNIKVWCSRARTDSDVVPAFKCRRHESHGSRGNRKVQVYFVDEPELSAAPLPSRKRKREVDEPELSSAPLPSRKCKRGVDERDLSAAPLPSRKRKREDKAPVMPVKKKKKSDSFGRHVTVQPKPAFRDTTQLLLQGVSSRLGVSDNMAATSAHHDRGLRGKRAVSKTLYLPHDNYWSFDCQGLPTGYYKEFETDVQENLPESFVWLLTQCSQLLEMKIKDLYVHLVAVEKMYFSDRKPTILKVTR